MANILDRFSSALAAFRNPSTRVPQNKDFPLPIIWHVQNPGQFAWQLIDYEAYASEGFSRNAVNYAAIKYKFDAIAQAPLRVYEGTPDNAVLTDDASNPLVALAYRPNEYMSRVEFMQYCVLYLNLHGNCFIYYTSNRDGLKQALYPLRPDRVSIIPRKKDSRERGNSGVKTIGYAYHPDGIAGEKTVPILPENMLHIKFPNPYDPLEGQGYGLSPMSAAAPNVDTDNYMTKFLANFFKNQGILPGGIVELPYEANNEDIQRLRSQMEDMYGGASNWGKPIVLDSGGKYNSMSVSFADMGLDQIDLRNIRRSTAVFGVPGRLIGLDEANSTYNNIQEAKEDFWQRTMYSELLLFEEEMRHKISAGDGTFLRFDVTGIPAFAEDTTSQVANYTELVKHFVPPNEAARIAGLQIPETEYGNIVYMPVGLVPAGQQMAQNDATINATNQSEPPAATEDEPSTPDDTEAPDQDMEDVEERFRLSPPQVKRSNTATHIMKKVKAWDFDTKSFVAMAQDQIARSAEEEWEDAIRAQFKRQQAGCLKIINEQKSLSKSERKNVDMNDLELALRIYLFSVGVGEWQDALVPLLIKLIQEAREAWNERLELETVIPGFRAMFLTRASIEGEAWFAGYTLQFAKAITDTTMEGVHAVIRDGLAEGFGTDKIGNKIELLFQQYMAGGTAKEDWAFMTERMPPYRTEMIARTETHGAMSNSNHAFFKRVGVPKKEWWATADARTRETHLAAWRKYTTGGAIGPIDIDALFNVGAAQMKCPGDKSAPLREFINCRCVELPYYGEQ